MQGSSELSLFRREGMILGHHGHPGLPPDGEAVEQLRVIGRGHQREIGQAAVHALDDLVAAAVPQMDAHLRKFRAEAGDPAGEQIGGAALDEADVEISRETLHRADLLLRLPRMKSCTPSSSSRPLIWLESGGWLIFRRSAARVMFSSSATTVK